jgi:hypothetical protein
MEYKRKSKKGRITIVRRKDGSSRVQLKNPIPPGVREIVKRSLIPYNTFDPKLTEGQRKYRERSNLMWAPSYIATVLPFI